MRRALPGRPGLGAVAADDRWRRLHPLSPLVRSGRAALAVLALAGLSGSGLIGSGAGTRWWDFALVALVAGGAVVNWLVTRWKVDGVTLRIETGLLRRDSRQLPIARIQAVDLVRPFLARMLGLAELRVRLAGSGDADGRLAYLPEQAAEALRARLLATHHGLDPATPEPAESVVTSVPTGRLAGAALIPAAQLAVLAVVVGGVTAAVVPGGLLGAGALLIWLLIICGAIAWRRVSTQYAFTVAASPDGVRIRRGLLGTVAETIPVARIQAVRMIEPLFWRPLHWCRLEVDVAGRLGHDRPEGTGEVRKALLPVGRRDQAGRLLGIALPAARDWPVPRRPPRRAVWKAPLSYHFLAAGHDGTLAVAVTGRVRRETTWVPLAKAQSVRLVQGPLQRRLGLATVHLDAAGKRVRAEFRDRPQDEARALVGELAALSRSARGRAALAVPGPPGAAGQADGGGAAGQAATAASPVNASHSEA
jgi:putative membrane protein